MHAYRIVWEDEAKAREVELFVDYTVAAGTVQIAAIRPTKVTFYNAETKSATRSIGIHTDTARRLLTRDYLAGRQSEPSLEQEIQNQIDLQDESLAQRAGC